MKNTKPDYSGLHPQAVNYLEQMKAANPPPLPSFGPDQISSVREEFNKGILQFLGPPAELASVEDITAVTDLGDITLRVYTPHGTGPFPIFIFIHGGGWVLGNLDTHDRHCRYISAFAECITLSVDYSPAPDHPFPTAVEECFAVCTWASRHSAELGGRAGPPGAGGRQGPIAVGGDSAGGNLSAAVALLARERGFTGIGFQLLMYPALNLAEQNTESYELFKDGYGITKEDTEWFIDQYVPEKQDRFNPLASPLLSSRAAGLPPAHIITAGHDTLRDDGKLYAEKLRSAGVRVTEKCYEDQLHGFLNYDGIFDTAKTAFREMSTHLKEFFSL